MVLYFWLGQRARGGPGAWFGPADHPWRFSAVGTKGAGSLVAAASGCRATDHAPRSSFYWVLKQLQSFVRTTKASAANETTIRYAQRQHRLVGPARTAFSVRPPPFAQAEQAVAAQKRVFISLASNRVWSSTLRSDTQSSTTAMVSVRLKRTELPHGSPTGAALRKALLNRSRLA